jgi:hypothetical protein
MIHNKREYTVKRIETREELADKLVNYVWCGCNGWLYGDMAFLNDSFSGDGAQEYAVFRNGVQIESITFGWCKLPQAIKYIAELEEGGGVDMGDTMPLIVPNEGHRCHLCA